MLVQSVSLHDKQSVWNNIAPTRNFGANFSGVKNLARPVKDTFSRTVKSPVSFKGEIHFHSDESNLRVNNSTRFSGTASLGSIHFQYGSNFPEDKKQNEMPCIYQFADKINVDSAVNHEYKIKDLHVHIGDDSEIGKIQNARNVFVGGKSYVGEIRAFDTVVLADNGEVGDIIIKNDGSKPYNESLGTVLVGGDVRINGEVKFEGMPGAIILGPKSDGTYPKISTKGKITKVTKEQFENFKKEFLENEPLFLVDSEECLSNIMKDASLSAQTPVATKDGKTTQKEPEAKKTGFEKVAGMKKLKQILNDEVIEPLKNPEFYAQYGLGAANGILLYGPPGCGKTFVAKALAEETGRYFVEISMGNIGSSYQNQTVQNLKDKFQEAIENAPSMVFLDEVEAIAPSREGLSGHQTEVNERVNELLTQLNNCADKGIFVICASNEPQKIDAAVKRSGRMDKRVLVDTPDDESRKEMFKMFLGDIDKKTKRFDYDLLSEKTESYISADIRAVVKNAARMALKEKKQGVPVAMKHLLSAIEDFKPSLSETELIRYRSNAD